MDSSILVAKKTLGVAEHMLDKTYPMVNDPRLLLAILEDIYSASMQAVSTQARGDTFNAKMAAFSQFATSHHIDTGFIHEMHSLLEKHSRSPVEFARYDKFVICDDSYHMDSIGPALLKRYLYKAESLLSSVGRQESTVT